MVCEGRIGKYQDFPVKAAFGGRLVAYLSNEYVYSRLSLSTLVALRPITNLTGTSLFVCL